MIRLRERRSRNIALDWSGRVRIAYQSEERMADKVRIMFVLKNNVGEYFTKNGRFSPDFTKARVYKRKGDATNSSYSVKAAVTQHKVVLIDPN